MKQQDLKAVLTQAARLRANICVAIDKSLQTHFHNLPIASACPHDLGYGEDDDDEFPSLPISSVTAASAALEARSLASIRDALEVLEEQLECLQFLSDEQREEKNATLAELEESRGILIRRLKQHPGGRESPVIKELLSFAGEPKEHKLQFRRSYTFPQRAMDTDWKQKIEEEEEDVRDKDAFIAMDARRESADKEREVSDNKRKPSRGLLNDLKSRFLTFLNRRLVKVSGKCLFAVAGAAAMLTLSNVAYGSNMYGRKLGSFNGRDRSRPCPKDWAAVHRGGRRCVLDEPFREDS